MYLQKSNNSITHTSELSQTPYSPNLNDIIEVETEIAQITQSSVQSEELLTIADLNILAPCVSSV